METTVTGFGNMLRDFSIWQHGSEPFGGIKGRKETNFPQRLDNILLVMVVSICAIYRFIYR